MVQSRWKSKVLWLGIVSIVLSVLLRFGNITLADSEFITQMVNTLLDILGIVGVVNNPTDGTNW